MPEDVDPPLLLVPGYMDSTTRTFSDDTLTPRWQALTDNLRDRGYTGPIEPVDLGTYGTTVGSPCRYAETVERAAKRLYDESAERVNVIAHSMGGLSTRHAVEQAGAAAYVDTLVTLGTPHQGSPYAVLGMLTPGGRDMVPGSRFLTDLNADGPDPAVDYAAVYSTGDQAFPCRYTEHAALPGAAEHDGAENIRVEGFTHHDLLTEDAVLGTYYDRLLG